MLTGFVYLALWRVFFAMKDHTAPPELSFTEMLRPGPRKIPIRLLSAAPAVAQGRLYAPLVRSGDFGMTMTMTLTVRLGPTGDRCAEFTENFV